ncbi:MAG: hypothetical protein ASARMPREDX12_001791 [Alectoria sarmentosa]|nr:MAG: hypothetical protein ASARMPREDX12_001791 [Alectoria sarmentosa]
MSSSPPSQLPTSPPKYPMPTHPTFAQVFDITLNLDYSNGGDFLAHYHNLTRCITTEQTKRLLHDETLKLIDGLRNGHILKDADPPDVECIQDTQGNVVWTSADADESADTETVASTVRTLTAQYTREIIADDEGEKTLRSFALNHTLLITVPQDVEFEVPLDQPPIDAQTLRMSKLEIQLASLPPKELDLDWTGLDLEWKNFCPSKLRGHPCPGLQYCTSTRVCWHFEKQTMTGKARFRAHMRLCQCPSAPHLKSTCENISKGRPCPDYQASLNNVRGKNGWRIDCAFGHDFEKERILLGKNLVLHEEHFGRLREMMQPSKPRLR